jgi:prolipoprotein diacylglyceryltransferase
VIASIPSPTTGVWHLGPLPLRAYAVCILAGIILAVWITGRRLAARGYPAEKAVDISAWAVPFGILGGRIYHVITTPEPYFGSGGSPVRALQGWARVDGLVRRPVSACRADVLGFEHVFG